MTLQPSNLRNALGSIINPDTGKDIVTSGMVKDIHSDGDNISIEIELDSQDSPIQERYKEQIEAAIRTTGHECREVVGAVEITFTSDTRRENERVRDETNPLPKGEIP